MRRLIILIELIIIIYLITMPKINSITNVEVKVGAKEGMIVEVKKDIKIERRVEIEKEIETKTDKYFYMTCTAYTIHPKCTPNLKGITATRTRVHEGVAAINVDWIKDKWIIKSPLKLGDKIYIEGLGNFNIEDTGYFSDKNYKQDYWNVDIYIEDYQSALKFGRKLRKVYILR
jgi:3D (Asp-Asp-Asp) domain-containing protein